MNEPKLSQTQVEAGGTTAQTPPPNSAAAPAAMPAKMRLFLAVSIALVACFAIPLYELLRFSLHSELYSHVGLVPAISAYLAWTQRKRLSSSATPAWLPALILGGAGIALLVIDRLSFPAGTGARNQDHLCMQTLAFVCLFATACAVLLGGRNLRTFLFPIAFLILTAPLPLALERGVESFLQHASAEASFVLLKLSGIPLLREGTIFILPGITLEVARECSGIHSTLVLFITAILAGQFFLRTTGGRITLAASVIVLGILRNAVRIFTLAQLTVHVDPNIIFSRLHRNGGPIFFAASLIPFFLLLWFLRKLEQRKRTDKPTGT